MIEYFIGILSGIVIAVVCTGVTMNASWSRDIHICLQQNLTTAECNKLMEWGVK